MPAGMTDDEPWPHEWHDYERKPDGSYHWLERCTPAAEDRGLA